MLNELTQNLVDVVALSKKQCILAIEAKLAYATQENFIGRIIDGYSPDALDVCLMTTKAAHALCKVQNHLVQNHKLGLFIYDAYRPLRTVKDFAQWFYQPISSEQELSRKIIHYPNLEKTDLVRLGYAPDTISRHNFGHAVDLVPIDLETKQPLNMGACFDFFDVLSHTDVKEERIGLEAYTNRRILSQAMQEYGFIPYQYEFWHFDFEVQEVNEPIDIPIEINLKNLNVPE